MYLLRYVLQFEIDLGWKITFKSDGNCLNYTYVFRRNYVNEMYDVSREPRTVKVLFHTRRRDIQIPPFLMTPLSIHI